MDLLKEITFFINDKKYTVDITEITPAMSLNTYLRTKVHLTGTKKMCTEGGCGACIVAIQRKNPITGNFEIFAVNSCLISIFSCYGWNIYTIEGIGSQDNPNVFQKLLADFNGTQCGFCSPGMVMNMFALNESKDILKMKDVENSFGGNICRCTGYRPILSAFKAACKDVTVECLGTIADIEELKVCKKVCNVKCDIPNRTNPFYFNLQNSSWLKIFLFEDLLQAIKAFNTGEKKSSYALVAGNTSQGVYKKPLVADVYIDVLNIKELVNYEIKKDKIILGANISLTKAMELFYEISKQHDKFSYLEKVADHIDLIANVPVRNVGTFGGNLMTKHKYREFPSDIFVFLETIGAQMLIVDVNNKEYYGYPEDFLQIDMSEKVLKKIIIPALDSNYKYDSFKLMPRAQNAHALMNAGFLLEFTKNNLIQSARIVYGAVSSNFCHAKNTEHFLIGKNIFDNEILQKTFKILDKEINPEEIICEPSREYKKKICISLFYKFILSIANDSILTESMKSGKNKLIRPVSTGSQDTETNESLYPLSQSVRKLEAIAQTTGEAEYIADMPDLPNQLFASFVLANAPANSVIKTIKLEKALALEGVVAFMDKNDIPGKNTFTPKYHLSSIINMEEELFCDQTVKYYHQPIGIIVATNYEIAEKASGLVEVEYLPGSKPLVTIRDILKANANEKINQQTTTAPLRRGNDEKYIIKGSVDLGWQYHFHMENHCCNVVPREDGLDMYPSSQWMDLSQNSAAAVLNIPANKINVVVKRLGGAFGGKIVRSAQISSAAALAAYKLKKPVKMWLPIETNFQIIGKRYPLACDFEAAVNKDGVIQYLNNSIYSDHGIGNNEQVEFLLLEAYTGCYDTSTWLINNAIAHTDMHSSSYIRAPGSFEGIVMREAIMEQIALSINMDPLEFRINNIIREKSHIMKHMSELIKWADVYSRKETIKKFNQKNIWRKKALSVIPMIYPFRIYFSYNVIVSIYQYDGSVAISHGGIEIGQGINTKAAQICAYKLGIPLEKVCVKASNNLSCPNADTTGDSLTSESVCWAIIKSCDILLKRMQPVKDKLINPTWEELVSKCHEEHIELTATYMSSPNDTSEVGIYEVYGVCAAEIELDVLTGQYLILRVDLLEDAGNSMNPQIDIGQVEGSFIFGLGYLLTEETIVNKDGEILSNRTWNYKPPGAKDIPIDFRVKFPRTNPDHVGVLKSKATGEPPVCLSVSVPLAIREAVSEVRQYFDKSATKFFKFDGPTTVEQIYTNSLHNYEMYTL